MIDPPAPPAGPLTGIASILQSIAWPIAVSVILFAYRKRIGTLIDVLTKKIDGAESLELWQMKLTSAVKKVADQAEGIEHGQIPSRQLEAAKQLGESLDKTHSRELALNVVENEMRKLASKYDQLRTDMPQSSPKKTRLMNEIAAQMRALSLAARPLLGALTRGQTAGERLAAICILQVMPEYIYFQWLIDRILQESQPFVFFQASVAILQLVREDRESHRDELSTAIQKALLHVRSFKGGTPDQNTIDILTEALSFF